mmetsp:Transcript_83625/g.174914  ORF Transcript_83625/g.174914 Transcript_83625/m.174914 type:complete len:222 (-) Transcript_83625:244-909(-)
MHAPDEEHLHLEMSLLVFNGKTVCLFKVLFANLATEPKPRIRSLADKPSVQAAACAALVSQDCDPILCYLFKTRQLEEVDEQLANFETHLTHLLGRPRTEISFLLQSSGSGFCDVAEPQLQLPSHRLVQGGDTWPLLHKAEDVLLVTGDGRLGLFHVCRLDGVPHLFAVFLIAVESLEEVLRLHRRHDDLQSATFSNRDIELVDTPSSRHILGFPPRADER